jgi:hypothetical protein
MAVPVVLQALWANLHAPRCWAHPARDRLSPPPRRASCRSRPPGARRSTATGGASALGLALVAAAAAEAATPFGVRGALFPLRLLTVIRGGEVTSLSIVEHLPPRLATLSPVAAFGMIALLVVGLVALVVAWRRLRLDHVLLAIAFGVLAFLARRNVALVGFGLVPLAASGFGATAWAFDGWLQRRRPLALAAELALVVALAVPTVRMITGDWYRTTAHLTRTFGLGRSEFLFSRGATDWLERHAPDARVFNDDELGGCSFWRGFPPRQASPTAGCRYPLEV